MTEPAHKGSAKTRRADGTDVVGAGHGARWLAKGWQRVGKRLAKVLAMWLAKVLVAVFGLGELGNIVSEGVAHGVAVMLWVGWLGLPSAVGRMGGNRPATGRQQVGNRLAIGWQ